MTTYRATAPVVLGIPNKLKANGQPAGNAKWRDIAVPADSRFTFYVTGFGGTFLTVLCDALPQLVKET